jgi:DNA-binding XRE family transcriptional regulator
MLTPKQVARLRRERRLGRNRLGRAIELAKVTQATVAEAVDSTQSHISAIAAGRYGEGGLPVETARRLARFFGCTIEDIFPANDEQAVAS